MKNIITLTTCLIVLFSCTKHPKADLIVTGKIWTGDEKKEWAEAMAIVGDSIVAVGTKNELEEWVGDKTEKLETAADNLIVPGFIDCHTHFVDGGFALSSVQLRDAKTPEEFIGRIKK